MIETAIIYIKRNKIKSLMEALQRVIMMKSEK